MKKRNILRQNNAEANAITKECIESALILLMKEKNFQDISITDITQKAGVSRTAYYRNYTSKEDILSNHLKNIIHDTSNTLMQFDPVTENYKAWTALLESTQKHASEYKLLLQAGYGDTILDEYKKSINKCISKEQPELYYSNCYWAGALYTVLTEWILNDMNTPISVIAEIGSNLSINGIHTIMDYGNQCDTTTSFYKAT
ncbi:TetR/AcrR family transcriptional regulator [Konateibacter massiliensis]|uniref:TetR/AcrR family transcriptional regulator n=1 Tax=Konateibacter massiliensis TaxID=2002841 RepID=UPI00117B764D|nr:TetR/AcrR family transcriptional regulator [Konateibacter massiliensis]